MSVSHWEVAQAFAAGKKATGSRMFTNGEVIYSYDNHFPIAMRLWGGSYLFNDDRRSPSTSTHQSYVSRAIGEAKIYECTCAEIQDAVRNPNNPIILTKDRDYDNLDGIMNALSAVCYKKGQKIFPRLKYKKMIEDDISISIMRDAMRSDDPQTRGQAALRLKEVHENRIKEAINMVIRLLDDEDENVAKQAYLCLMQNMARINGRVLSRVDRILKNRTDLTYMDPHAIYVGSINARYQNKSAGGQPSSILLHQDDDEILWYAEVSEYRHRLDLVKLKSKTINRLSMVIGEKDTAVGKLIVTSTVAPDLYAMILALLVLEDL